MSLQKQSLGQLGLVLQFFSPTGEEKDGGVLVTMPSSGVTKSSIKTLVDGTKVEGAQLEENKTAGTITIFIPNTTLAALGLGSTKDPGA